MGIGIIGYGSRIKEVLRILINENPNHKIIAVCDINKKSIEYCIKKFGEKIKVYIFEGFS